MSSIKRLWSDAPDSPNFLSERECREIFERVVKMTRGGGSTNVSIQSGWEANLRWAMNTIISAGDTRAVSITISRRINNGLGTATISQHDDDSLRDGVRRAEWSLLFSTQGPPSPRYVHHFLSYTRPHIYFPAVERQSAGERSKIAREAAAPAETANLRAAGYIQVDAYARALYNTDGLAAYYRATDAQYSTTVRNPAGTGSGWAGISANDWSKIDTTALSAIAIKKCQTSMEPRALEPGRYTTILEPQAVHDLFKTVVGSLDRATAEGDAGPFNLRKDSSKLGLQVLDRRLTLGTDPMDVDGGYIPFDRGGEPYQASTWIQDGVLSTLAYDRRYAVRNFGTAVSRPNPGAYRLRGSGATHTIDEMVATTKRGVLATRLYGVTVIDGRSLYCTGVTRDGLWLIENGKIAQPIKNFRFNESPLFVFNAVEEIGAPVHVFSPTIPVIVPAMKVRDFNFVSLADAV